MLLLTSWNCYELGGGVQRYVASAAIFSPHQCDFWPYNLQHWTLSTLAFSWLLYPALRRAVLLANHSSAKRAALVLALLALTMAPALVAQRVVAARARGAPLGGEVFGLLYEFPPIRLLDFLFGMGCAQLAADDVVLAWRGWPALTDAAALLLLVGVLATPRYDAAAYGGFACNSPSLRCGYEALWVSGGNLAFGVLLIGGACPAAPTQSHVTALATSHCATLVGRLSFHIYLLQELVCKLILGLQLASGGRCTSLVGCATLSASTLYHDESGEYRGSVNAAWWPLFAGALVAIASVWSAHVEEPWVRWLRRRLAGNDALAKAAPSML